MITIHLPNPQLMSIWIVIIVIVLLSNAVLDLRELQDLPDDLEKQKYFQLAPATQQSVGKVVIATYKQTSRIQCRHRCNRNDACTDAVIELGNECLLLGQGEETGHVLSAETETISKIKVLMAGKRKAKVDFREFFFPCYSFTLVLIPVVEAI